MRKILVVQSRTNAEHIKNDRENFERVIGSLAQVEFLSALDEKLAWSAPDTFLDGAVGVIFSGSADFDFHGGRPDGDPARIMSLLILARTKALIAYALASKVPFMGICYGHQLIANMYGGEVGHDKEQSKFGSYEVRLTEEGKRDALLKDLPESFIAQYAHKDAVTKLPHGATLLANTDGCKFSALRYAPGSYTFQFHPETTKFADLPLEYKDSSQASRIVPLWIERFVR